MLMYNEKFINKVNKDKFLTDEEKNEFWSWLERILKEFPDDSYEQLVKYLELYKEMRFQST